MTEFLAHLLSENTEVYFRIPLYNDRFIALVSYCTPFENILLDFLPTFREFWLSATIYPVIKYKCVCVCVYVCIFLVCLYLLNGRVI